jgi:hypothetical protein
MYDDQRRLHIVLHTSIRVFLITTFASLLRVGYISLIAHRCALQSTILQSWLTKDIV